ncbi:ABC-type bacteriocin/lantibiotic exporter with double-glycine peptidase domain [Caldalkalibacillus uzonensis]|uniref:ABC-type bacteriocin/lantibiotic exporter with double-glycine peptidase domain n=1 Tax=Caldalkalibacillus uzonensis TaxID=353224 RepID=A0ABU0CUJ6_9BACI|nr:ABC-type bacteriocin/lantibiotic exporter with double-glycine peptidase domain [Caldalkalibacillus uzonensis]
MKKTTTTIITLLCSFLLFAFGIYRILTGTLSSTPLIVAYIFAITGFFGIVVNIVKLRKIRAT